MALIKTKEVDSTGISGDYWRILEHYTNDSSDVVTLQLYASKAARTAGKSPLAEAVQFIFQAMDHPLDELNVDTVVVNNINDFRDLETHVRYQHIKAVATVANGKAVEDLTPNERKALFFYGATDDLCVIR